MVQFKKFDRKNKQVIIENEFETIIFVKHSLFVFGIALIWCYLILTESNFCTNIISTEINFDQKTDKIIYSLIILSIADKNLHNFEINRFLEQVFYWLFECFSIVFQNSQVKIIALNSLKDTPSLIESIQHKSTTDDDFDIRYSLFKA